MKLNEMLGLY